MIFSRSKRVKEEKKEISDFILPPSSTLSTKGCIKIVDKWVPDKNETINDTPGPGAYHIKDSFSVNKGLKFNTKTVESKVKREHTTPGPGQYALDNNVSTLIKKSFNTHNHLPLYKINNDGNESNDKLNPTRIQGIQTTDDNKVDDDNKDEKSSKLRTRKDIKQAMLSIRSLAITGEIEDYN